MNEVQINHNLFVQNFIRK